MQLDVVASGMVTPVGYHSAASCAAIRVGLDNFREIPFLFDGALIRGAAVDAPDDLGGISKLAWMAVEAINQCVPSAQPEAHGDIALALCVAEASRPGRPARLDERFFANVCSGVEQPARLGPHRRFVQTGSLGGIEALQWADQVLSQGLANHCIVAGVDSYLSAPTLQSYYERRRLLTEKNTDGFIPGEAGTAVLVSRASVAPVVVQCMGVGWGVEKATQDSDLPLRGDGLAQAYREAFKDAGCGFPTVDYRMADISGDQYAFKEAALAVLRTLRVKKDPFYLWHPADCIGRVGAASVPLILGIALAAARRSYAPGPGALCHFTEDSGTRAATILRERRTTANAFEHRG